MEFAKRGSRRIAARVHTVTELGKYSGKYALADILVCGCCGTPYRRKIYMYKGNARIPVWRCIRRMDKGSDCPESATLKEDELFEKNQAEEELEKVIQESNSNTLTSRRIDEIIDMLSALKNHPYDWDDVMIRQLIDKIVVEGKNHIRIIFIGGYEVERQW